MALEFAAFIKSHGKNKTQTLKLLYYAQGIHFKYFGEPLFEDEIEARQLGPVVRNVFNNWDELSSSSSELNLEAEVFLEDVLEQFKGYSAGKLMDQTHSEPPWKNTKLNDTISIEVIEDFFKQFECNIFEQKFNQRKAESLARLNKLLEAYPELCSSTPPQIDVSRFLPKDDKASVV